MKRNKKLQNGSNKSKNSNFDCKATDSNKSKSLDANSSSKELTE